MKPAPAPDVPGDTPWERLDNAIRGSTPAALATLPKAADFFHHIQTVTAITDIQPDQCDNIP
jgi:hypothetical protein